MVEPVTNSFQLLCQISLRGKACGLQFGVEKMERISEPSLHMAICSLLANALEILKDTETETIGRCQVDKQPVGGLTEQSKIFADLIIFFHYLSYLLNDQCTEASFSFLRWRIFVVMMKPAMSLLPRRPRACLDRQIDRQIGRERERKWDRRRPHQALEAVFYFFVSIDQVVSSKSLMVLRVVHISGILLMENDDCQPPQKLQVLTRRPQHCCLYTGAKYIVKQINKSMGIIYNLKLCCVA